MLGVDPTGVIVKVGTNVIPVAHRRTRCGHFAAALRHTCHSCAAGRPADCITPVHLGIHRWGGYAEFVRVPALNTAIIPDNLDFAEAA